MFTAVYFGIGHQLSAINLFAIKQMVVSIILD